ncbi:hypothetical protein CISG_04381 [Coccidioides immitis RMSCC 3703]|uniref:CSN8/PSMD8/EIF3K domain-containing protein n=1 Tax=Coccidioides immitis RMSCC 3703 TaxID=454286 RepID=A0A0J8QR28_COCIT|nr:hypothetical protein CISG_04381 [Coccidioides immitis RMSCC 3703]
MSTAPQTLEELSHVLTSAPSAAALLQALMDAEGEISLRFGETHVPSDTEFLRTYYSAYFYALLLRDEIAYVDAEDTAESNKRRCRFAEYIDFAASSLEQKACYGLPSTERLSITYGAIRPETAALYLGFNLSSAENDAMGDIPDSATSELIAALVEKGWEYDSDTKLLKPVPRPVSGGTELDQVKIGKLAALLGNYGG